MDRRYLYVFAHYISNTFIAITMAFPAGWLVYAISTYIYYKKTKLGNSWVVSERKMED